MLHEPKSAARRAAGCLLRDVQQLRHGETWRQRHGGCSRLEQPLAKYRHVVDDVVDKDFLEQTLTCVLE